jgi:hypothetical protein
MRLKAGSFRALFVCTVVGCPSWLGAEPVAVKNFSLLPQSFEPNRGQAGRSVEFIARGPGYALALGTGEAWLRLSKEGSSAEPRNTAGVHLKVLSANRNVHGRGLNPQTGKSNYLLGNHSEHWQKSIPHFGRVEYDAIYPGIDLAYYGTGQQLEYDFIVRPKGDVDSIRLEFEGADQVRIDPSGDLVLSIGGAEVRERRPVAYQNLGPGRVRIEVRYVALGPNRVGFQADSYDPTVPLIIDPVLMFSTYFGVAGTENAQKVVLDSSGNAYYGGSTNSGSLPGNRIGQPFVSGSNAAWIAKVSPSGALLYTTFIGGGGGDISGVRGLAVDASGNVYASGSTRSSAFPLVNPLQSSFGGSPSDTFVLELNSAGSGLIFSTFLGGNGQDYPTGVAIDNFGTIYVAGVTTSTNFPTVNAWQKTIKGTLSAFATKIAPGGSSVLYSTYLTGSGGVYSNGMTIDSGGNLYIYGDTGSTDFTTLNAIQPTPCTVGPGWGWLVQLNSAGTPVYSTYICGPGSDTEVRGAGIDATGNLIITGATGSTSFPLLTPLQSTYGGGPHDIFITKLSPNGGLLYSSYLGGNGEDVATGLVVDQVGNWYLAGNTGSTDFPLLNSVQSAKAGGNDTFVSKINSTGSALLFSTYLGGSGSESTQGLAVDDNGQAYVSGTTPSTNFPLVHQLQGFGGGANDAFWAVIATCDFALSAPASPSVTGGSANITLTTTPECGWRASSSNAWITLSTATGTGSGPVSYSVASNPGLPRSGTLTAGTQTVTISQSGALSPASLAFGNQGVNTTSASQTITVTSPGPNAMTITSIGFSGTNSGDFAQNNTCPVGSGSLAPGATCTIAVTFTPPASGPRNASLALSGGGFSSPLSVALTGTGAVPAVTVSPTTVTFGNQGLSTSSAPAAITLTNNGPGVLNVSTIAITGTNATDFAQTNNCPVGPATLAVSASCTVNVTFSPTAAGANSASISISDNASGSPQTMSLTGTGVASTVNLSSSTLSFVNQNVGGSSAAMPLIITNGGPGLLTISGITITGANSGDYAQTNNCPVSPATLAVSGSCTANVTFTPGAAGSRSATLNIADNGASSPQTAGLSGTGVANVPAVALSPSSVSFGNQNLGTTSNATAVTVTNNGPGALTISSIAITGTNPGDFAQTNNCPISPATLAVSASCTVNVSFSPASASARSASITITDNGASSPQTVSLSGTGVQPVVTLSPATVVFGNQTLNTASAATPVTVTNSGPGTLTISSVAITGTNPGDFSQTNNCPVSPATLAVSASCTVNVTFTPTVVGSSSASLNIADNGASNPQSVSLSGSGVAPVPVVNLSPARVSFGNQNVGTTSGATPVSVTNNGPGPLTISTIAITGTNPGDFSQTNNCPVSPSTLVVSASCTVNITFTPAAASARSASVTIADNGASSPQVVALSGTGVVPTVTLSPASLSFGSQTLNTSSSATPLTITNNGPGGLTISGIGIGGANSVDYAQTNNCPVSPATLAASSSCTVNVTFTPTVAGASSASLNITDNGASSPQSASLSGTGVAPIPVVSLTPGSLSYGSQNVGTASSAMQMTITNNGPGTLNISSIVITGLNPGDFSQTNNCPASLAVSASCVVNVTFAPAASGSRSASVSITDNGASSPQSAGLSGNGVSSTPVVSLAPSSLSFGNQTVSTTSSAIPVTVTNNGPGALNISTITITGANAGDFAQTNNCPASMAATSFCTVNVTFTPSTSGSRTASLSITDNGASSPQTAPLTGTGAVPTVALSPTSLSFPSEPIGVSSPSQTVTITNSGPGLLSITSIAMSGANPYNFTQTNNCPISPASLAANASCTVNVTFTPNGAGTRTASLTITDNGVASPQKTTLTGTGVTATVTLSPTSLSFGNQNVTTSSAPMTVTVGNSGPGLLTISSITISGTNVADFTQTNNCPISPATLAANTSCVVNVSFTPPAGGSRSASLSIADNGASSPQSASLTGTGVASTVTLSPASLSFGDQTSLTTSAPQPVTITNAGPAPLTFSGIGLVGANAGGFRQVNNCPMSPATLAPGAACTANVSFSPGATGSKIAWLQLTDNGVSSPQNVTLTGNSVVPAVSFSPAAGLSFGSQAVGTTSTAQTLTITNSGPGQLTITGVSLTGTNPGDFTQTNNCVTTLAVNGSCTVTVNFKPTATGSRAAAVALTDNGNGSPQTASLTGTGI